MITHPLIYCDWLEEQGKNVILLREDLECYMQNENRLLVCDFDHFCFGDGGGGGDGDGNGRGSGYGMGFGYGYGYSFGDGCSNGHY